MEKEEFEGLVGVSVSNEMFYGIIDPMYRAVPALREKGFRELMSIDGIRKLDGIMQATEMSETRDSEGNSVFNTDDSSKATDISDYFNSAELDQLFYDTPLDLDEAVKELVRRNNLPF